MVEDRIICGENNMILTSRKILEPKGERFLPNLDKEKTKEFEKDPFVFLVRLSGPGVTQGKIELNDMIIVGKALTDSLERYAIKMSEGGFSLRPGRRKKTVKQNVKLMLTDIKAGSVGLFFELVESQRDLIGDQFGNDTIISWTDGISQLHNMSPVLPGGFDRGVLKGINELKPLFYKGIDEVEFNCYSRGERKSAKFDMETSKKVDTLMLRPASNRRTISGIILEVNFASPEVTFTLHTKEGKEIPCMALEEDWGIVYDSMLQHVRVTGEARIEPESEEVLSIRADNIEIGGGIELNEDIPFAEIREFWKGSNLAEMIEKQGVNAIPKGDTPDWQVPTDEEWARYEKAMIKKEKESQRIN